MMSDEELIKAIMELEHETQGDFYVSKTFRRSRFITEAIALLHKRDMERDAKRDNASFLSLRLERPAKEAKE